jgi:ABC-type lipoprotein export system ATPase subunit
MVEIKKVTKTFKKGLGNKIKAINKTSLNLDDTGLVALLGPSGCGKTTLLNAIGGLDKINRGKILINNKNIASKFSFYSDRIRNNEIGYIFQDYKLLENLSVFDNISIVLKMQGVKNKNEIKEKVEYVLEKVGMIRYKRRPAAMLSGGEKQRVAIARAIVKNPRVLLCDEPTGNLDSKNSLEVMKIIKSISKDRLVVLVT